MYYQHEWETNPDGTYKITGASEPIGEKYGLLPHINCLSFDEYDMPTGITEMKGNGKSLDAVYTIDGRKMSKTEKLRPGIYIKGGKKMVVR